MLLQIVNTASIARFPAPLQRLSEFGLEPPQAILQLNDTRIEIGGTNPMNHRRYLRIEDQIHLINDRFPQHLMAAVEKYISRNLLPSESHIIAIRTPKWNLTFNAAGQPRLEPPVPGLSADILNRKLVDWRLAAAAKVVPQPDDLGTEQIDIELKNQKHPLRFIINRSAAGTFLTRTDLGLAYLLPIESELLEPPTSTGSP